MAGVVISAAVLLSVIAFVRDFRDPRRTEPTWKMWVFMHTFNRRLYEWSGILAALGWVIWEFL